MYLMCSMFSMINEWNFYLEDVFMKMIEESMYIKSKPIQRHRNIASQYNIGSLVVMEFKGPLSPHLPRASHFLKSWFAQKSRKKTLPWEKRDSLIVRLVGKDCLQCKRPWFNSWVWKIPWRRDRLPMSGFLGFPCGSAGKQWACNVGGPWVWKIPWKRERLPTPIFWPGEFHRLYSPWGHKELDMWLSDFHFHFSGRRRDGKVDVL